MSSARRYIITGGGTAGHISPAIAIADALRLKEPNCDILYVGGRGRIEETIVPGRGYPLKLVRAVGMPMTKAPMAMLKFLFILTLGVMKGIFILLRHRPHAVIGTGGYVSAPVIFAAVLLRRLRLSRGVVAVHEQNVVPGRLNHLIAGLADIVWVSFASTIDILPNSIHTGYPVRAEIATSDRQAAKIRLGIPESKKLIFAVGGSTGSRTINRAVIDALPMLIERGDIFVIHGMGKQKSDGYDSLTDSKLRLAALIPGELNCYRAEDYFNDIALVYAAADLVVCRSGAGTLAEICAMGRASLLIPKAGVPGDAQALNARDLVHAGAAEIIYEDVCNKDGAVVEFVSGKELFGKITALLDDEYRLRRMEQKATEQAAPGALAAIVSSLDALLTSDMMDKKQMLTDIPKPAADPQQDLAQIPALNLPTLVGKMVRDWEGATSALAPTDENRHDHLIAKIAGDERTEYLRYRTSTLLSSPVWEQRNVGIKLVGLLRHEQKLPVLLEILADRQRVSWYLRFLGGDFIQNGFIRRNGMKALAQLGHWTPEVKAALSAGLSDPYFEVRAWAADAIGDLSWRFCTDIELEQELITAARDSYFEVSSAAVRCLGQIAVSQETQSLLKELWLHDNWKIREAVVGAFASLLERGIAVDSAEMHRFLENLLVTCEGFVPTFPLKRTVTRLAYLLTRSNATPGGA